MREDTCENALRQPVSTQADDVTGLPYTDAWAGSVAT